MPFGSGGKDEEVAQGRLLVDVAACAGAHLVYSSVRGADRMVETDIDHADSKLPLDQVRHWAGDEIADMFQHFEDSTDFLDADGLHARYPEVEWHSYADWARTVDWDLVLSGRSLVG